MFGSLKKMYLERLLPFRDFSPLKTETTLVEKCLFSYSQIKLLGNAPNFYCASERWWCRVCRWCCMQPWWCLGRSAVYPMPSRTMDTCDGCWCCERKNHRHYSLCKSFVGCSLIKPVFPDFLWHESPHSFFLVQLLAGWAFWMLLCRCVSPQGDGKRWAVRGSESKWLERAGVPAYTCRKCWWRCCARYFAFSTIRVAWESFSCPLKDAGFQKGGLQMQEFCVVRDGNKWQNHTSGLIWKHATIHCACLDCLHFYYKKVTNPKHLFQRKPIPAF